MRTWKWMVTACLLTSVSAMAQQPTDRIAQPPIGGAAAIRRSSSLRAPQPRATASAAGPQCAAAAPPRRRPWTRWWTAPLRASML